MSEALLLLEASLTFPQGFNPKWWDGEEVEGGSSFSGQTLFDNMRRLSSHSVPWLILWVQPRQTRTFSRKKKERKRREERKGPGSRKWGIRPHFWGHAWSACLAIFPQVILPPPTRPCHAFYHQIGLPLETGTRTRIFLTHMMHFYSLVLHGCAAPCKALWTMTFKYAG